MWPLVFAFLSSKVGHSALIAENSQSSMVMVLLFRLAKDGFLPLEVNCTGARQAAAVDDRRRRREHMRRVQRGLESPLSPAL